MLKDEIHTFPETSVWEPASRYVLGKEQCELPKEVLFVHKSECDLLIATKLAFSLARLWNEKKEHLPSYCLLTAILL